MAGAVKAGDRDMLSGSAAEGGNQEKAIVVVLIEYNSNDRNYTVRRDPSLTYFVLKDGGFSNDPSYRNVTHDMRISDYDGKKLFRAASRVQFFGINTHPTNIIIPVSVRLSDATSVDGTISIDVACDPRCPEKSITLLNGDFCTKEHYGFENRTLVTADSLSKHIRNTVADCGLDALSDFGQTFNIIKQIRSAVFDKLYTDVKLSSMGLEIVRASIRFGEAMAEKIMRLRAEGKIQMAEDEIEFDKRMLKIDLAKKEYEAIHGSDE